MLAFLHPAWLGALAVLALPVALHLWSRHDPDAIRVGSLRFVATGDPDLRRRPRVRNLPLLLLRASLLAALVLAAAGPRWNGARAGAPRPWALVQADVLADPSEAAVRLLDSLRRAGNVVRALPADGIWSGLAQADVAAPAGTPFVVVARPTTASLRGTRPSLKRALTWLLPPGAAPATGSRTRAPPGRAVLILRDTTRRDDARYLRAALWAADSTLRVTEREPRPGATDAGDAAIVIWLGHGARPLEIRELVSAGRVLLTDAADTLHAVSPVPIAIEPSPVDPPILARRASIDSRGLVLWRDGFGTPLLVREAVGGGAWYRYGSRFTPEAGDIVYSPVFLDLAAQLAAPMVAGSGHDLPVTAVTVAQAMPRVAGTAGQPAPVPEGTDLLVPLWLLAVALFGVERALAGRRRR